MVVNSNQRTAIGCQQKQIVDSGQQNADPYKEIYEEMAVFERSRNRLFWGVLAFLIGVCAWLIYLLNKNGGLDGLF